MSKLRRRRSKTRQLPTTYAQDDGLPLFDCSPDEVHSLPSATADHALDESSLTLAPLTTGDTPATMSNPDTPSETDKCHFFDTFLPELRLAVYEELLLYNEDDSHKQLCPQGLATCRFIHQEAQDVLNKNLKTTMLARISVTPDQAPSIRRGLEPPVPIRQAENVSREVARFQAPSSSIRRAIIELEVSKKVTFRSDFDRLRELASLVHFQLYLQVSEIQVAPALQKVDIKIRTVVGAEIISPEESESAERWLKTICTPINGLPSEVNLSIQGMGSSTALAQFLQPKLRTTALVKWVEVSHAMTEYVERLKAAGIEHLPFKRQLDRIVEISGIAGLPDTREEEQCVDRAAKTLKMMNEGMWKAQSDKAGALLKEKEKEKETGGKAV